MSRPTQSRSTSVVSSTYRIEIVPILDVSDGDPTHRPRAEQYSLVEPSMLYLNKLAEKWLDGRDVVRRTDVQYMLSSLPSGYRVYERPRPSDSKIIDRFLYGHPDHRVFTSPNEFYPHFKHLMNNNGNNMGCPCKRCGTDSRSMAKPSVRPSGMSMSSSVEPPKGRPAGRPRGRPRGQSRGRPVGRPVGRPNGIPAQSSDQLGKIMAIRSAAYDYVDEEHTPDTVRRLIDRLKERGTLEQDISESLSMDWVASRASLQRWTEKLSKQPSWVPREGEIVLFVRNVPTHCGIDFDLNDMAFKLFDVSRNEFVGMPVWEAGVVGQDPAEPLTIVDLIEAKGKNSSIAYSGFRVEPLPEPNQGDKSLSKAYKYVPMSNIRPFAFYQRILKAEDREKWHPTIWNALTVMSSVALVGKHHFKGTWPHASIICKGIYIGAEFITTGDVIKLAPQVPANKITDVLEVTAIKLKFSNLDKASNNDTDDGHPYNSMMYITGKAFTFDRSRAFTKTLDRPVPPSIDEYGEIYWLHDPAKSYQVAFGQTRGRCHELSAMRAWFPAEDLTNKGDTDNSLYLSVGLSGMTKARRFSTKNDTRILPGKGWLWAETRLEALDVHSLNGVDAAHWDDLREERLEEGHKAARVLSRPTAKDMVEMRQIAARPKAGAGAAGDMTRMGRREEEVRSLSEEEVRNDDNEEDEADDGREEDEERGLDLSGDAMEIAETPRARKRSASVAFAESSSPPASMGTWAEPNLEYAEDNEEQDELAQADASTLLQAFQTAKKPRVVVNID